MKNYEQTKNLPQVINNILRHTTYNYQDILKPTVNNKCNILFGIGLMSTKYKETLGLPLDIFSSLTTVKMFMEAANTNSKLYILIADQMAVETGGDKNVIDNLVMSHKSCFKVIMQLLKISEYEILLSSTIMSSDYYKKIYDALNSRFNTRLLVGPIYVEQMVGDEARKGGSVLDIHNDLSTESTHQMPTEMGLCKKSNEKEEYYFIHQIAHMHYFYEQKEVGIKISYINSQDNKQLSSTPFTELKFNDVTTHTELKFDVLYKEIYGSGELRFLNVISGCNILSHENRGKIIYNKEEVVPYMANSAQLHRIIIGKDKDISGDIFKATATSVNYSSILENIQYLSAFKILDDKLCFQGKNKVAKLIALSKTLNALISVNNCERLL